MTAFAFDDSSEGEEEENEVYNVQFSESDLTEFKPFILEVHGVTGGGFGIKPDTTNQDAKVIDVHWKDCGDI